MRYIKIYRYIFPLWKKEILILFLSLFSVCLSLINPYLTKLIIDKAYANKDLKLFIVLIAAGGLIFILNGLVNGAAHYLNNYIMLRITFNLNKQLFKKLQALPYGFFQDSSTGRNLFNINYDISQLSTFIADALPRAVTCLSRMILILLILLYIDWKMSLSALALSALLYIVPYYFTKRLRKIMEARIENSQGIFEWLQEILSHMQLVKAFGRERSEVRRYISSLIKNTRLGLENTKLQVTALFLGSLASRLALGSVIFFGGYQVIKGRLTLGSLSAITIYLTQLFGLQDSLAQLFQETSFGLISCQRLEKILESEPHHLEDKQSRQIRFCQGKIEFKEVSFGYLPERPVLKELSFSIIGGSCVGLAGPSGCGKTTIVNLILRLYGPEAGKILIDGHNIASVASQSLYHQIGAVLQEPFLWNDTVENNIRYGNENAGIQEIIQAAKAACIDSFVDSLPRGYASVIGENACKISEGQKQRIAIARAVIKQPKILILDEALSSVDAELESRIIDNLRDLLKESTIIVISHRLSTIKKMESICFFAGPNKVFSDTHDSLLEKNVQYRNYLAHQLEEENTLKITSPKAVF